MRFLSLAASVLALLITVFNASAQSWDAAVRLEIERQAERLRSADVETRRDAVTRLRALQLAEASRAAISALKDNAEIIRATAAEAVIFLPSDEAANLLLPLLRDKSEFVRRETAFALGQTGSKTATPNLIQVLLNDKMPSVRAAAAIALGRIGDNAAVASLAQILLLPKSKKNDRVVDEFVRRSAAEALGRIRHQNGAQALIAALRDETNADDIRREAARALGLIADQSAIGILQANLNARDPYLAEISAESLRQIKLASENKENNAPKSF